MTDTVLVINSGSSSLKYQLVDPASGDALASGLVERIGESSSNLRHDVSGQRFEETDAIPDHKVALERMSEMFQQHGPQLAEAGIVAVGHRVVQGGKYFDSAALVTEEVIERIDQLSPLAPLHNPANLTGIRAALKTFSDVPHTVVFDTAFFRSLPGSAATYALNSEVAHKYEVRRYGAHGTSHEYVSGQVSALLEREDLKTIVLHLGNGASVSAVDSGLAKDTSMGLTPLEGLVMGTRTGDIDAAVVFHLFRNAGMSIDEIDVLFNRKSGMKGLAGDNDMRAVWAKADDGDDAARAALDVYIHRLRKYVGAYAAVLGGLDVLTFTAGIGENDSRLRSELCESLGFLGVELDAQQNEERSDQARVISTPESAVTVMVVPTNEELAIARQTMELIS